MTQLPETTGKVAKLNRVERNAWTQRKIFDAATKIVGKFGYAEASVARITEAAGVAQGQQFRVHRHGQVPDHLALVLVLGRVDVQEQAHHLRATGAELHRLAALGLRMGGQDPVVFGPEIRPRRTRRHGKQEEPGR